MLLTAAAPAPAPKPTLLLLSGLPLLWPEGGVAAALQGEALPAARAALGARWTLRPIELSSAEALAGGRLLLAAQPRAQSPADLAALDRWVRRGGRLLLLADSDLRWPSRLPLGHPLRPPTGLTLAPLLRHWRVTVAPGRVRGQRCESLQGGAAADCRIGKGRAIILADADLLRDSAGVEMTIAALERLAGR